ncbi:hypothetical protein ACFC1T_09195 [Kitasatospora sp. NPDC056076]|uniref:hypothetical protein n=1 Tax=Kitasatospora sp. NPDC056076 TaxID=3345703 RepID=UPI0035D65EC2
MSEATIVVSVQDQGEPGVPLWVVCCSECGEVGQDGDDERAARDRDLHAERHRFRGRFTATESMPEEFEDRPRFPAAPFWVETTAGTRVRMAAVNLLTVAPDDMVYTPSILSWDNPLTTVKYFGVALVFAPRRLKQLAFWRDMAGNPRVGYTMGPEPGRTDDLVEDAFEGRWETVLVEAPGPAVVEIRERPDVMSPVFVHCTACGPVEKGPRDRVRGFGRVFWERVRREHAEGHPDAVMPEFAGW